MNSKILGGMLAVLVIATTLTTTFSPRAEALDNGLAFGAYAAPVDGLTNQTAIEKLERQLGSKLPMVRTFGDWDDPIGQDKPLHRWIRDGDRQLMASIKPQRDNEQEVRWRDIADAQPGSKIHDEMVDLAQGVKRYGDTVILGFHHEPEHKKNLSFGDSSDYKAAFRKFHDVFEQQGVRNVRFAWIMTSWAFEVGDIRPDDRRIANKWYPGDGYVDYISVQEYNWAKCRNDNDSWESLEDGLEPFMRFARKHPDKQLILAEFGTAEGNPGQRADWLDDARALLKRGEYKDRFAAALYFHYDDSPNGNDRCDWWLDSSSSSLEAARRMANDGFFRANITGGDPPPAGGGGNDPVPAPEPGDGECTATRDGNRVTLRWTPDGGTPVIRRNGTWVATPSKNATSWVDNNDPDGATYIVRSHDNGRFVDHACTGGGAGEAGCSVQRNGDSVTLRWSDDGGRHVIRRNGDWPATIGKNVESFTDRNAPNGAPTCSARGRRAARPTPPAADRQERQQATTIRALATTSGDRPRCGEVTAGGGVPARAVTHD